MRRPWSLSYAARYVSSRAASIRVALSASFHWIAWNEAIGWPNCRALGRVVARRFERALREADRQRGDADAAGVEHLQRVDEPLPFLAEQVIGRHAAVARR